MELAHWCLPRDAARRVRPAVVGSAVHQFAFAPMIVERGDVVSTPPERLARRFGDRVDLVKLPFRARDFSLSTTWHPRSHQGHVWLRRQLAVLAKDDEGPGA